MEFYDKDGRSVSKDELWCYANDIVKFERYPFDKSALQWLMRHRHKNGLDKVVQRRDRRLLIRLDLFEDWLNSWPSISEIESGMPVALRGSHSE